ncbi:MAG: GWxTD domain-containing protein [Luteibaculaceae bacterium]
MEHIRNYKTLRKYPVLTLFLGFGLLFFSGCSSKKQASKNLAPLYNKDLRPITINLFVYQVSEDSARLYYKLPKSDLLFSMTSVRKNFEARVNQVALLKQSLNSTPLDTLKWVDTISEEPLAALNFESYKTFKLPKEKQFYIELQSTDINRVKTNNAIIEVNLVHEFNPHKFKLVNASKGTMQYNHIIEGSDLFILESLMFAGKSVDAYYYNDQFEFPLPPGVNVATKPFPFLPYNYQSLDFAENGTLLVDLKELGFLSTANKPGEVPQFTLLKLREHYPYVPTAKEMVNAVRYLTNNSEYDKLTQSQDAKKAMDEFWLIAGGNISKAKKLIKIYYNRVEDANRYFVSHTEGWKTDRGLIYLIFGPPDLVQKKEDAEIWLYGEADNFTSYSYTFARVKNPFSNNDFRLMRDPAYKSVWFLMVDNWRKGRIKD